MFEGLPLLLLTTTGVKEWPAVPRRWFTAPIETAW